MLDINLIRQKPEWVEEKLRAKGNNANMSELLSMDESRRKIIASVEDMKAERNRVSKTIPMIKKEGGDISAVTEEMRKLGDEIKALDDELDAVNAKIKAFMDALPNLPADDVIPGGKEANQVVNVWGEQPKFDFAAKDHVELATGLNLIDYERGAKLGGNGFWIYKGKGAMLEWALINYFIETHISDGYEFILLVEQECTQSLASRQLVQPVELILFVQTDKIVESLATELYQQVFRIFGIEIEDERSMSGRSSIHLPHEALPFRQFQLASHTSCRIDIGHDFIVGSIQGKVDGICTSDGEDAILREKDFLPHPLLDSTDGFFLLLVLAGNDYHKACQERYDMFGFHWFTF